MKNKVISLVATMIFVLSLTGCNSNKDSILNTSIDVNKEQLEQDTVAFLKGTKASELESYDDSLEIQWEDICNLAENANTYTSHSAYYLQYGNYMYRFQLNNDGKVISYIKYKVEA